MSEKDFCDITGSNMTQAKYFLEKAKGDLNLAVNNYFQNGPVNIDPPIVEPRRPAPPPKPSPQNGGPRPGKVPEPARGTSTVDDIFNQAQKNEPVEELPDEKVSKHKITFWKNGFQVDDGEYRQNDDPANADFLDSCSKGRIPKELYKPGMGIDVAIEDRREKEYVKPKVPANPFAGNGRSMDGVKPIAKPPAPSPVVNNEPRRTNFVAQGQQSTKIRVQYTSGTLVTLTVPVTSTILELKRFICENNPSLNVHKLTLSTTLPMKELNNLDATIQSENLRMAMIVASEE